MTAALAPFEVRHRCGKVRQTTPFSAVQQNHQVRHRFEGAAPSAAKCGKWLIIFVLSAAPVRNFLGCCSCLPHLWYSPSPLKEGSIKCGSLATSAHRVRHFKKEIGVSGGIA